MKRALGHGRGTSPQTRRALVVAAMLAFVCMAALWLRAAQWQAPVARAATPTYRGVLHVHTRESHDGHQDLSDVVDAAVQAQLQFVVLTEHNVPSRPAEYVRGVLVLHETEWSLDAGHMWTLAERDDSGRSPTDHGDSPAEAASAAVRVAAHPFDRHRPFEETRTAVNFTENESASAQFRDVLHSTAALRLLLYPLRPALALTALLTPSRETHVRQALSSQPLCAVDDHGWVQSPARLQVHNLYLPLAMPTGQAETDRERLLRSLLDGEYFCATHLLGDASGFSFSLNSAPLNFESVGEGGRLSVKWIGDALPADVAAELWRDGERVLRLPLDPAGTSFALSALGDYRVLITRPLCGLLPALFGCEERTWVQTPHVRVRPREG